ncbi:SDR family oxidoreductase [Mycobacterium sp. SMC-2]|uniref:SDR family NAD(P)-dependent oxidoreductase n=1 Tax=Mycobacterium sp. SMC-2 TaxID=2857058 RepID=UPI0021B1C248|nr:SDR family NAD(P)-dependent oxidoreductase [Mycobacterium sp. SMC-2]UXA05384.1 SDR family oxidoreductase [Mycobacterium sp. SMC-2]
MAEVSPTAASLRDATIVVTGGASGIGLAAAEAAAEVGAAVMLADRDRGALDAAHVELKRFGTPVATHQVDVADAAQVQSLVEATLSAFGRVDGLVTSAGIERSAPAVQISDDDFDEVLRVNLKGTFLCAQAFARAMVDRRSGGSIVTVSSALAFSGRVNAAQYTASKGAVVSLTKSLAIEWGPLGIRVNSVAPGLIATPITSDMPIKYLKEYASRTPLGRIGTPEDVAKAIRFLLSDESSYVTGQTLVVNGGFLMPS